MNYTILIVTVKNGSSEFELVSWKIRALLYQCNLLKHTAETHCCGSMRLILAAWGEIQYLFLQLHYPALGKHSVPFNILVKNTEDSFSPH